MLGRKTSFSTKCAEIKKPVLYLRSMGQSAWMLTSAATMIQAN
jgi:hypothetical protein